MSGHSIKRLSLLEKTNKIIKAYIESLKVSRVLTMDTLGDRTVNTVGAGTHSTGDSQV